MTCPADLTPKERETLRGLLTREMLLAQQAWKDAMPAPGAGWLEAKARAFRTAIELIDLPNVVAGKETADATA
jgi:hypothetical protein